MLSERSATERVHFSAPERPFRSSPGDVALIFSSCYFFFCIKTKEEVNPSAWRKPSCNIFEKQETRREIGSFAEKSRISEKE